MAQQLMRIEEKIREEKKKRGKRKKFARFRFAPSPPLFFLQKRTFVFNVLFASLQTLSTLGSIQILPTGETRSYRKFVGKFACSFTLSTHRQTKHHDLNTSRNFFFAITLIQSQKFYLCAELRNMIEAKINGMPVSFPAGWSEVTVGQFLALRNIDATLDSARTFSKILEIFTAIPAQTWYDMEATESHTEELFDLVAFTREKIDFNALACPEKITIDGKEYDVPKELRLSTYGQVTVFESKVFPLVTDKGDLLDAIPSALAIIFQPLITGKKFDGDTLNETEKLIHALPILVAYPVASFFLKQYFQSLTKRSELSPTIQPEKNSKPELTS